VISEIKGVKN